MNKQQQGIFYSKNNELIKPHLHNLEDNIVVIDPFCGEWDLLNMVENVKEGYDIQDGHDTLLSPPDYKDKFILTNPPYLARNKAEDKQYFELYDTDDLYKAALLSFKETGERGIVIIPTGFWFNERNTSIRKEFLTHFKVSEVSLFNKRMFEDTDYTVCSFYFERGITNTVNFGEYTITYDNTYSIIKQVEKILKTSNVKITRYVKPGQQTTTIHLQCLDNITKPIHAYLDEPMMGKSSDRAYINFSCGLNGLDEEVLCDLFNSELNRLRTQFNSSFLSNFRNNGRKRISFTFAYKLLEHCIAILEVV